MFSLRLVFKKYFSLLASSSFWVLRFLASSIIFGSDLYIGFSFAASCCSRVAKWLTTWLWFSFCHVIHSGFLCSVFIMSIPATKFFTYDSWLAVYMVSFFIDLAAPFF